MSETEGVVLDGASLTPEDVVAVACDGASVEIADTAREAVRASRERVDDIVASGQAVYGLNTGFGQLVNTRIEKEEMRELQANLVRSHASGAGRELREEEVRAMLVGRVNALVKGYSGVREEIVDLLVGMVNEGVTPVVRSRGSLGASGDLAPLAHLALVLIGEGEAKLSLGGVRDAEHPNERLPGGDALAAVGLEPLELEPKEGLALINGTPLSAGLAAFVVVDGERAARAADAAGALTTEVTMSTTANCASAIQDVRPHVGQSVAAANIRELTADSEVVESHRNCDRVQDAYAIRCLPQVHGAVRDALRHLREAVEVELNSATDNPLVFDAADVDDRAVGTETGAVLSGGNFHGEPLALRLDYATSALCELAAISERRTDRLLNPNVQEKHLPAFLAAEPGRHSGFMIPQYTAAALLNEIRSLGRPSTDNTPVSGGQEDHVSMSLQSAYHARTAVANTHTVLGVELLCGAQAVEYLPGDLALGQGTSAVYDTIRAVVDTLDADRALSADMDAAADLLTRGVLDDAIEEAVDDFQ